MEESALNKSIQSIVDTLTSGKVNVGEKERWASVLGGGALVLYALKKRSWPSLALALLGGAFIYRGTTGHCPAYQALKLNRADPEEGAPQEADVLPETGWVRVEKSILIRKTPEALYSFLQNVENLPRILDHLESVRKKNHHHSHWIAKATKGTELEWEAEAINEKLDEQITWRAIEEGGIDNLLSVHLEKEPGGEGTQVRFLLQYNREHSLLGAAFARLFGDGEKLLEGALDRLKQIIETEETASEAAA
jgi:uncharacterized membrane protein